MPSSELRVTPRMFKKAGWCHWDVIQSCTKLRRTSQWCNTDVSDVTLMWIVAGQSTCVFRMKTHNGESEQGFELFFFSGQIPLKSTNEKVVISHKTTLRQQKPRKWGNRMKWNRFDRLGRSLQRSQQALKIATTTLTYKTNQENQENKAMRRYSHNFFCLPQVHK